MIRGIGCGINELDMVARFLDLFDLDFFLIALRYTLDRELPYCQARNVGVVIGGVFKSGILATGAEPGGTVGVPVGAKYTYEDATPEQVAANLRHFAHPIRGDLWEELKHETLLREDAPVPATPQRVMFARGSHRDSAATQDPRSAKPR